MSLYPNVKGQDLLNLAKIAEQQNNSRKIKIKNSTLNLAHDKKD